MKERKAKFLRNNDLESLLSEINQLLSGAETERVADFKVPQKPVLFVIGAPRSGTTLMVQWLASTGAFAYPTNLMSRFYAAPYIGSLITQLITDPRFQYRDEFKEMQLANSQFASSLGKTAGIRQPNEFWYFWRRFFPIDDPQPLANLEGKSIDPAGFAKGIAAIEHVFDKPFATKGMLLQYDLDVLCQAIPKPIFIFTRRKLENNVDSILRAREKFFGNQETWYSAKPEAYKDLKSLDPVAQVIGQIEYTNRSIEKQFSELSPEQFLNVEYESFCESPEKVYSQLIDRVRENGCEIDLPYSGAEHFEVKNRDLDKELLDLISAHHKSMFG